MIPLSIAAVVLGLAGLVWSADRFVVGASATATNLGVSPLIIGLVIVGFGTSAPEMLISSLAAVGGNPALGIGNAIGSNIANIGLIVGSAAIIWPLTSGSSLLRRELPILLGVTVLAIVLLFDRGLGRFEGVLLLLSLLVTAGLLVRQAHRERDPDDPLPAELAAHSPPPMAPARALTWLGIGLVALLASSQMLVWGAVNIAEALGVSELVIGLSIVALGTSLPELATGIASAIHREHDLLLGNVIGSNLFNTLAVLGLPAVIHPSVVAADVLTRDLPVMALLTLALIAMLAHRPGESGRINRVEGGILLLSYCGYLGWLSTSLAV